MASSPGSVISIPQKPSHLKCGLQKLETKGLKSENLRDNTPGNELTHNQLAELTTKTISRQEKPNAPNSMEKCEDVARRGGKIAGSARKAFEKPTQTNAVIAQTPITKSTASQNRGIPGNQRRQKQQVNVDLSGTRERLSDASTSLLNASFDPRTGTNHRQKSTNFRYSLSRSSSISRRLLLLEAFWPSLEV